MNRDETIQLSDEDLQKICRVDVFRGVGPGGQKRNKTETAVRVTHLETELFGFDDTSRSQHLNKHHAMQKLRLEMALHWRDMPRRWEGPVPSPRNDAFIRWLGFAFDALDAAEYKVAQAAEALNLSTSKLVKILQESPAAWQFLNSERQRHDLLPLRANR